MTVVRSCLCGECDRCKNTLKMRRYWARRRANGGKPLNHFWVPPAARQPFSLEQAWLAGIIDGEGCIKMKRLEYRTPSVSLVVGMTHEESVRRCLEIAGKGTLSLRSMKHRIKPLWAWAVYSDNAKDILWQLLPLLVTKRDEAEFAVFSGPTE